jgi:protein O-mannosyl-transferase
MRLFKRFDGIRADAAAALVLVVLVIAAFGITATFGFVDYDDQEVVFNNPFVSAGLTWTGLRWAWGLESRPDTPDWFNWPLTWMTHQADCQAYGLWAGGHHVTNIMLHAGGTVAIFAFLRTLPFSLGMAFVMAAIYGIHPAQIESVAWITSRKNVLSALFFFGSLYAFMRAHHAAGSRSSIPATLAWNALGMAALLSKATVATLPLVLLLADWWPLRRIRSASGLWRCIQEKLFLLAFSVWTVVIGYRAQNSAGAIHISEPLLSRLEHAVQAVAAYLWMFISPVHLSPLYLCPEDSFFLTVTLVYGLLIGSITMAALGVARSSPGFTFGWLWFLLTLAPTVGLIPFGGQAWACRHLQIPMAGLLIAGASVCVAATLRCRPSRGLAGPLP